MSIIAQITNTVGKTCIVYRYSEDRFRDQYEPTIGVEFSSKNIKVQSLKEQLIVKTQIWDTAGQENFKSITRNYYKGAIAGLLIYDVTNKDTFENLIQWYKELQELSSQHMEVIIVGNKMDVPDQERQVTFEQGLQFSQTIGKKFFECSAKSGQNINEIFHYLAQRIVERIQNGDIDPNDNLLGIKIGKRRISMQNNSTSTNDSNTNKSIGNGYQRIQEKNENNNNQNGNCYC